MFNRFRRDKDTQLHISDELLSVYLDGEVTPRERAQVSAHLAACVSCRENLGSLRQTVAMVQSLPRVAVPRVFTVTEAMVGVQRRETRSPWIVTYMRAATVTAAMMLVVLVGGDFFLRSAQQTPQIVALQSPARVVATQVVEKEAERVVEKAVVAPAMGAEKSVAPTPAAPEAAEPLQEKRVTEPTVTDTQAKVQAAVQATPTPQPTVQPGHMERTTAAEGTTRPIPPQGWAGGIGGGGAGGAGGSEGGSEGGGAGDPSQFGPGAEPVPTGAPTQPGALAPSTTEAGAEKEQSATAVSAEATPTPAPTEQTKEVAVAAVPIVPTAAPTVMQLAPLPEREEPSSPAQPTWQTPVRVAQVSLGVLVVVLLASTWVVSRKM